VESKYSLFSDAFRKNPHAVLRALREEAPVHWHDERSGHWTVTGYADVAAAYKDHERLSNTGSLYVSATGRTTGTYGPGMGVRRLSSRDDPSHGVLRRLMAKPFTPRALADMRPRVDAIVDELIEGMRESAREGRPIDFVHDFAYPLTVLSVNLILGVPTSVREVFDNYNPTVDDAMGEYFKDIVRRKEKAPGDDMTSDLIAVAKAGHEFIKPDEVHYHLGALWTAGNWTTTLLLTNAAASFQSEPGVRDALSAEPALIPSFIEESLRYDAPVLFNAKTAKQDFELGGHSIKAGQYIIYIQGAANRDPRVFADPDRFDVRRSPNPQIAFADGVHHCLGAPLARMEAISAFERLSRPDLKLELDTAAGDRYADGALWGYRRLPATVAG